MFNCCGIDPYCHDFRLMNNDSSLYFNEILDEGN
jgi:hypothetical protein